MGKEQPPSVGHLEIFQLETRKKHIPSRKLLSEFMFVVSIYESALFAEVVISISEIMLPGARPLFCLFPPPPVLPYVLFTLLVCINWS